MNYTDKHHLPQWEKSDRILMDDFNQAMARIETGLSSAANGSAVANAAAAAAAQAQSTANSAVSKADAAQETANNAYSPSHKPYVVGTYTGNGTTVTLYLGFKPSFLIVTNQGVSTAAGASILAVIGPHGNMGNYLTLTSSGVTITNPGESGPNPLYPRMNNSGQTYSYIAFR